MSRAIRIASLLPSATEIVYALGLGDRLVGVSHSCDYPRAAHTKPVLTRLRFAIGALSSGEIDAAVRRTRREFGSVYEIAVERLAALEPDLVLTQGVCEVCAAATREVAIAARVAPAARVLALDAHDVAGTLAAIRAVGRAGGAAARAEATVRHIGRRLAAVRRRVRGRPTPRVLALEWLDPPFVPGHWVPDMITLAGGTLLRGRAGTPSYAVSWDELTGLDPDFLLLMPCGFDLTATLADADRYRARLGRVAARAIGAGHAFAVDASSHFSRPGPRIADGVELLAALFHPGAASLDTRAAVWA